MRFADNDPSKVALLDFMPRDRSRHSVHIIFAFICTIAAVLATLRFSKSDSAQDMVGLIVCIMLAMLCMVTLYFRKRSDDLVLATEFQNLLYSSAASLGSQFCIIAKRDATVVHASPGLSDMFNGFPYSVSQSLEGFFIEGRLPKFDQDKIHDALLMNERKSLLIKLSTTMGISDMVVNIDPLPRPHGYYAIRGRYYQGQRKAGSALHADISPETMRHLIEESPVGHFVCDDLGRFEYINPALATLVGRTPQDMIEARLHITDILKRVNGNPIVKEYEYHDMREEVLLVHTGGKPTRLHLELSLIREGGKTARLVGTITQE